jgi:hypothetical protein
LEEVAEAEQGSQYLRDSLEMVLTNQVVAVVLEVVCLVAETTRHFVVVEI